MTGTKQVEVLESLTGIFAERVKRPPLGDGSGAEGALASVLPSNVEEVRRLAEVAARYSVPLVPFGAGTGPEPPQTEGAILVRFDMMRDLRAARPEEPWIEAEPGVTWLQLEDALRPRGRGLVVYPTSAPRATVGGWLAQDGLGVGSYEYGWLRENVLSAGVVLAGGELREITGDDVGSFVEPGRAAGIVVGATLKTRRSDADVPFVAEFAGAADLAESVAGILGSSVPLWHLAFLNPSMSRARTLGESYLLFGAYPRERETQVAYPLREAVEAHGGRVLGAADAYRTWGERFFPVMPSGLPRALAIVSRELITVAGIREALADGPPALQGTVARSGEVLLIRLDAEDPARVDV